MRALVFTTAVCGLLIAAPAMAQNAATQTQHPATQTHRSAQTQSLSQQDQRFVKEAADGSLAETELGKLAERKGGTAAIREFGRWMVTDHGIIATNWLKAIMSARGEKLQPTLSAEHQQMQQKLQGLSGAQFDREYIRAQVADHEKDVPKFQQAARTAQDPMLKSFAEVMAPALEQHLTEAKRLARETGAVAAGHATERSGSSMPSTSAPSAPAHSTR